jgi:hypothetical protein
MPTLIFVRKKTSLKCTLLYSIIKDTEGFTILPLIKIPALRYPFTKETSGEKFQS